MKKRTVLKTVSALALAGLMAGCTAGATNNGPGELSPGSSINAQPNSCKGMEKNSCKSTKNSCQGKSTTKDKDVNACSGKDGCNGK